jgi:hypothetical protein
MEEVFRIKHQDRDIIKEVQSGKIRFHFADGAWHVGLEMRTFEDFNLDDPADWNEEDYITIHLQDYPVGEKDPRTEKQFEINVPKGFDAALGAHWTNLYFGEHFETNNNSIRIGKLSDDRYFVEWQCTSADVDYYDSRARDNAIVVRGTARVVDSIQYPW